MNDRLIAFLNRLGFQPVRLAKTDIEPPQLYNYTQDRVLARRGPFKDYVKGKNQTELLARYKEYDRPDLVHVESSSKNASASISFLEAALKAIGISGTLGINLQWTRSREFKFSFTEVTAKRIEPSIIDQVLSHLDLQQIDPEYVENGHIHIAYEYLYCNSLLMRKGDESDFEADISASPHTIVDASVDVNITMDNNTTIRFKSKQNPAGFAYKAGRLQPNGDGNVYFYPEEIQFMPDRDTSIRYAMAGGSSAARYVYTSEMEPLLAMVSMQRDVVRKPYVPAEGIILQETTDQMS